MRKIKVCHFSYSFLPLVGGMEEVMHNLSLATMNAGCEPFVFAPRVRGKDNRLDVPYRVLRYSRPSSRRFGLRQILLPLLWYHWKYRFDVLHCHGAYPPGYVGVSFQQITGIPVMITPHGGDIRKNEEGNIVSSAVTSRIRKTFSRTRAITAISSSLKEEIISLNADPSRIHLIPNGIWLEDFRRAEAVSKRHEDRYILYLGRLVPLKGVDILIRAFAKIAARRPDIRLKIAGQGREGDNLRELARASGVAGSIDFLGLVRGEEKLGLLANALFLALPSRREGLPVAVLEAFASGLPAVASRTGGSSDIIRDGKNGFLVPCEDADALAEKCLVLMNDDSLRKDFAAQASATASSYDWSVIASQYMELYRSIIDSCN